MKLKLKDVLKHTPCKNGWDNIKKNLKSEDPEKEFTLIDALELNGLNDAVWALRTKKYKSYCLFLADLAESVSDIYAEDKTDISKLALKNISAIRDYHSKKCTYKQLQDISKNCSIDLPENLLKLSAKNSQKEFALIAAFTASRNIPDSGLIVAVSALAAMDRNIDQRDKKNKIKEMFIDYFK